MLDLDMVLSDSRQRVDKIQQQQREETAETANGGTGNGEPQSNGETGNEKVREEQTGQEKK